MRCGISALSVGGMWPFFYLHTVACCLPATAPLPVFTFFGAILGPIRRNLTIAAAAAAAAAATTTLTTNEDDSELRLLLLLLLL